SPPLARTRDKLPRRRLRRQRDARPPVDRDRNRWRLRAAPTALTTVPPALSVAQNLPAPRRASLSVVRRGCRAQTWLRRKSAADRAPRRTDRTMRAARSRD